MTDEDGPVLLLPMAFRERRILTLVKTYLNRGSGGRGARRRRVLAVSVVSDLADGGGGGSRRGDLLSARGSWGGANGLGHDLGDVDDIVNGVDLKVTLLPDERRGDGGRGEGGGKDDGGTHLDRR